MNTLKEKKRLSSALEMAQKRQRILTVLIVSMTLTFYFSWLPYAINALLTMSGVLIPHVANVLAILFAKSGTVINPVLYIFFNQDVSKF